MADNISNRVPPEVRQNLKKRRTHQAQRGKEFKVAQPRQTEPRGLEREFQVELKRRQQFAIDLVKERLLPRIEELLREYDAELPTRRDALGEDLASIIAGIKFRYGELFSEAQLKALLRRKGIAITEHNLRQFRKVFRQALGVDPFKSEPWLSAQAENFVTQNVSLISTVDERYFNEIEQIVHSGARKGLPTAEIQKMIAQRGDVSKSRAALIARDQVNKFNGQLNKLRQQDVGVERYRWRTSLDERVRPQHSAREGKIYSWDEPPSDGHPGEPIQCRCYAEPVLEDLVDE